MKNNNYPNRIKRAAPGFTLIELLVVISIIGLLSSLGMVTLNSARIKARDALRLGQIAQLRTALNMYYDENNEYPICNAVSWIDVADDDFGATIADTEGGGCWCYTNALEVDLKTGSRPIMSEVPHDPLNSNNLCMTNSLYNFRYISTGQQYALVYTLEETGEKYIRGW